MKEYFLTLLNNALRQTDWTGDPLTEQTWRGTVRERLQTAVWDQVVADVRPFLGGDFDLDLLTLQNLMRVLG